MKDVKMKRINPMDNVMDPLIKPISQQKTKAYLEKMKLRFVVD